MTKKYLDKNVFEAAKERISFIFDEFDHVSVSFSGGKDSTVLLHLAHDEAVKRNRKIDVLFVDLEAQYKDTIKHVHEMMNLSNIDPYWVCLPINLRNAVSNYEPQWCCWDPDKRDLWVRGFPERKGVITDTGYFDFYKYRMEFEDFVPLFADWQAKKSNNKVASLIGIRSDESFNRYSTIINIRKRRYKEQGWTTQISDKEIFNVYPIYDWGVEDIWTYIGKNKLMYNELYDKMYLAGRTLHNMRICQPYGDDQRVGLDLFKLCEPDTWERVLKRVLGVNYGNIYCNSKFMGYRKVELPPGHTWESYAKMLLKTIPPYLADHYKEKINVFFKWWCNYCGGRPEHQRVASENDKFDEMGIYYSEFIPYDGYKGKEAPDTHQWRDPLWKRVCRAILKNDFWGKTIGFSQVKESSFKLEELKKKYEDML